MKFLSSSAKIVILLGTLISFSRCFQYPEGPVFTLQTRDERLEGTWAVIHVTDPFGNDVTNSADTAENPIYTNLTLTVEVTRSGDRTWALFKNTLINSLGTYQFADFGDQIVILYSLLDGSETFIQKFYTIRKLTDKDLIYVDDFGYELEWKKY